MRARVLVMVALLAVASVMAAMAYITAEVYNSTSATVVRTDVALLALDCAEGTGYLDENCWIEKDGLLYLDLAKGLQEPNLTPDDVTVHGPYKEAGNWWLDVTIKGHKTTVDLLRPMDPAWIQGDPIFDGQCVSFRIFHGGGQPHYRPKVCAAGTYGIQPGSMYDFGEIVRVTNNSEDTVDVTVDLPDEWLNSGMDFTIEAEGQDLAGPHNIRLGAGESAWISIVVNVPADWSSVTGNEFPDGHERYPFSGTLTVRATAVTP